MRAVMVDVPDSLLAERRRLGHDRFDEMWEGELHMVPPPRFDHHLLAAWLVARWYPLAGPAGVVVTTETGLFDPAIPGYHSYRQPDVAVCRLEHASERGIEGRAELVVEIRSPDDETYAKIPFYDRVGVIELLVIETDLALRCWRRSPDGLVESAPPGPDGWMAIDALPVTLRRAGGTLEMREPGGQSRFEPLARR